MSETPLQPFAPPAGLPFTLPTTASPQTVVTILFAMVMVYWTIYTVVAVYHWLHCSHRSAIAIPAIGTHLLISFVLASYALSGLL
ncbi:MAG: hypothetical protein WC030_01415 [Candidatus Paceibacterota bacterium]